MAIGKVRTAACVLMLALLPPAPTYSADDNGTAAGGRSGAKSISNREIISQSHAYMAGHPDQRWRRDALQAYRKGRHRDALRDFRRAARHADKVSQAIIAQAYWQGELGLPQDRALAYVWMDLAAERGYRDMLAWRESYWSKLTEAEQARALEAGREVFAEYGDEAAKPRHRRQMIWSRYASARTRTEHHGFKMVILHGGQPGRSQRVHGDQFYADEHWDSDEYWDNQDYLWHAIGRGQVDILPLRPLREDELP